MEETEEVRIDLQRLCSAVWKKAWQIGLAAALCGIITFLVSCFLVTPRYTASARFYVNNHSEGRISSGDLSVSRNLVDSCIVFLDTSNFLNTVTAYAGVDYSVSDMRKMISAAAVNETEFMQICVTCSDPREAAAIAEAITIVFPQQVSGIMDGVSAIVVEPASIPVDPSSPGCSKMTLIGFLTGFALAAAAVILRDIFDTRVQTEEDITLVCNYPILATVPSMPAPSKGYSHPLLTGEDRQFSAVEAYKLLRTKLQFFFADGSAGQVIGISSAHSGEGKSLTSVNLAYTLAELGERVLLIDCDMRHPTLAQKLHISQAPGLSDYLAGQIEKSDLAHPCGIRGHEDAFYVIPAGQIPPNPIELLSSPRMKNLLASLRGSFDYILLDLPPAGEVSDALAVAGDTDGILLVVRQNSCDRVALNETIQQFKFIRARILGVVFNHAAQERPSYAARYRDSRYSHP